VAIPDPNLCHYRATETGRMTSWHQCGRKIKEVVDGVPLCAQHIKIARLQGYADVVTGPGKQSWSWSVESKQVPIAKDQSLIDAEREEERQEERARRAREDWRIANKYRTIATSIIDHLEREGWSVGFYRELMKAHPDDIDDMLKEDES
jgi:hypothetical protein